MCRSQVGLDVRVGLFATIGTGIAVTAVNEVPLGYQFGVSDSQMGCHEFHWGVISVGVLPLVCIKLYTYT